MYPAEIALDTETYGFYHQDYFGRPLPCQTQFHPTKMEKWDRITTDRIIQLVSVSWEEEPDGPIHSRYCLWQNPAHRLALRKYVKNASTIIGHNLPYDLRVLRHCDPYYQYALRPFTKTLIDTSILNYLANELRPERSLKAGTRALSVFVYDELPQVDAKGQKVNVYTQPQDPSSIRYANSDTYATLKFRRRLEWHIAKDFPHSDKLSIQSRLFYSNLLWTLLDSEENGVAMSPAALKEVLEEHTKAATSIVEDLKTRYSFPIAGTGSGKAARALVTNVVDLLECHRHPKLKYTDKTSEISTGRENLTLLRDLLEQRLASRQDNPSESQPTLDTTRVHSEEQERPVPQDDKLLTDTGALFPEMGGDSPRRPDLLGSGVPTDTTLPPPSDSDEDRRPRTMDQYLEVLTAIDEHRKHWKLVSAYAYPLLYGTINKAPTPFNFQSRLVDGIAYPDWYPVPSALKDEGGEEGGTQQGRVICKHPPLQVQPYVIKNCTTTRFRGGYLLWFDYSQIELRVPALLSNDPVMVQEYLDGVDRHIRTAELILSIIDENERLFQWKDCPRPVWKREGAALPPGQRQSSPYWWRQLGKTLNFLIQFRGEAYKLVQTAQNDLGLFLKLVQAQKIIDTIRDKYPVFTAMQEQWIQEALTNYHLDIPITGQSRSFLGTKETILATYIPVICNFRIQTIAALICLSAWTTLRKFHYTLNVYRQIIPCINIYDSLGQDVAPEALGIAYRLSQYVGPNPPYYQELCKRLGRTLPLEIEFNLLRRQGDRVETVPEDEANTLLQESSLCPATLISSPEADALLASLGKPAESVAVPL